MKNSRSIKMLWEPVKRAFYRLEDTIFDWRFNISTGGILEKSELKTDSLYLQNATSFQSAYCRNIRVLIQQAIGLGFGNGLFIDIGCGKGRACFYAARYSFKAVIGIDFAVNLIENANSNKARYQSESPIDFEVADAAEYRLPKEQVLVFLFNPFDQTVMNAFVSNNLTALKKYALIACANDLNRHIFLKYGMKPAFRDDLRKISLWRF